MVVKRGTLIKKSVPLHSLSVKLHGVEDSLCMVWWTIGVFICDNLGCWVVVKRGTLLKKSVPLHSLPWCSMYAISEAGDV